MIFNVKMQWNARHNNNGGSSSSNDNRKLEQLRKDLEE